MSFKRPGKVLTTTAHTRNTGHSSARAPRLGRRLVAGFLGDGVRLPVVLRHVHVNEVHDVGPDGRLEDSWQRNRGAGQLVLLIVNIDQRSR